MPEGKTNLAELVYLLYFGVMFGARAAGLYEGETIYSISLVIGAVLFVIKLLLTKHTPAEYAVTVLLLAAGSMVYVRTGEKGLLLYLTLLLGMKGVSLPRVERWALTILGVCFPLLNLVTVTGLVKDIAYPADGRFLFGALMRRSLGYPYFNTMFTTYIVLMALIMLCRDQASDLLLTSLFLLIIAAWLYIYSASNTGMIVTLLYLPLNFYLQKKKRLTKAGGWLILLLYPLCLVFSILGPLLIRGGLFTLMDKVFHNRFTYSRYYLTTEPVTLFGVRFAPGPNDNYYIDSSFLYSFLQIGIIPCILLTLLMLGTILHLVREDRRIELAILVSFCVLGLSDPFFYNLSYKNLLFLFAAEWFWTGFQRISTRLPDLWRREICLFPAGSREIVYEDLLQYKIWRRISDFLGSVFAKDAVKHFSAFLVTAFVISTLTVTFTAPGNITGRVDEPGEWEVIRAASSAGIWGGIAVMLLLTGMTRRREKKVS